MQSEPGSHRQITSEEAWRITCHEAGHAVVAVLLGIPFLWVKRGEGEFGEVEVGNNPFESPNSPWTEQEITRWQLFYAGGAAAEQLLFGSHRAYASRHDQSIHDDLENRRQPRTGGWGLDLVFCADLLDRKSIEKIAKKLDRCKELSDEDVYLLLGREPPWYRDA